MSTFQYRATDQTGRLVDGVIEGTTMMEAMEALNLRGLRVEHLGVAETRAPNFQPGKDITSQRNVVMSSVVGPLVGKVALSHLQFFFRQLGTMLGAGVPPIQSLETLSQQALDFRLKKVIKELSQHVREGRPITAGMQRYPEVFSPLMVSMVRAGEEGGMIDKTLTLLANYIEQEIKLRNLVRRLTLYPKIVVAASIVIVIAANAIIKMMAPANNAPGLTSPLTEPATWAVLTPMIIALFIFFRVGLVNTMIKGGWDMMLLYIPYLGKTVHMLAMAKFGRAFAAMYKGGVPIQKAVMLAADACGSEHLRGKMYNSVAMLEQGYGISESFASTGAFSGIVLDMTRTGETTGNLDEMLDRLSEFYEDDAATRATTLAYIVGTVALLMVAAYVGYMVITFYMGLFSGHQEIIQELERGG